MLAALSGYTLTVQYIKLNASTLSDNANMLTLSRYCILFIDFIIIFIYRVSMLTFAKQKVQLRPMGKIFVLWVFSHNLFNQLKCSRFFSLQSYLSS